MACHTPGCTGDHDARTISHSVIYQERTIVLRQVPASVCPGCGDAVLSEEVTIVIADLLRRKARHRAGRLGGGAEIVSVVREMRARGQLVGVAYPEAMGT